jgi:hypothetical protein
MKYNKRLSIILAILVGVILIAMSDNLEGFNTPPTKEKAITENGKDTLINITHK